MEFIQQYHIVILGLVFLGIIMGMTFLTHQDKKWIKKNYKKENIIALGFGVLCYGLSSDPDTPKKHKGFLLIHKDGLLFKTRFSDIRYDIPGKSIQKAYPGNSHKGKKLYQSAVKIDFLTSRQNTETIAFKLAYPPQWIKIIGKTFIGVSARHV